MRRIKKIKWVISLIIVITLIIVFTVALLRFSDEPSKMKMNGTQNSIHE